MKCAKCSRDVPHETYTFCPFCGARLTAAPARRLSKRGNGTGCVFKRANGTYTAIVTCGYEYSPEGKLRQLRRSKGGFSRKIDALNAIPSLLAAGPVDRSDRITVHDLHAAWREAYLPRVSSSTMACYDAAFRYLQPLYAVPFKTVRVVDWQQCIDACPNGKRTKQNMKNVISLLYQHAQRMQLVSVNKSETLYTGDDTTATHDAFTPEQLSRIASSGLPYATYIVALCLLGFRPGELLALRRSSYDPDRHTLVGGGKTKAGTDRLLPVSPALQPIIDQQLLLPSDYLFPRLSDGARMSDNYFRKYCFEKVMAALNITGRVPYSCRHTFANLLKDVSGSDTDKAALMGHSDISMTRYYQSDSYESLKRITDQLHL